jgi:carbon monoxide dehydrogenase subunit G
MLPHRHIGIRIKGALIAAIYNKALSVDLTASKEGVGKLNNLMSVDVSVVLLLCTVGVLKCIFLELSRKTGRAYSACRCVSLIV